MIFLIGSFSGDVTARLYRFSSGQSELALTQSFVFLDFQLRRSPKPSRQRNLPTTVPILCAACLLRLLCLNLYL
jgi:hypothetical protein